MAPAPRTPWSADAGNDSGAGGELATTGTRDRQHQFTDLRAGGERQGRKTCRTLNADGREVRRAVSAGNRSLYRAAVRQNDTDLIGTSDEMARGDDNAGLPMNAAGGDAMASIDGDDSFSCLIGECGGMV